MCFGKRWNRKRPTRRYWIEQPLCYPYQHLTAAAHDRKYITVESLQTGAKDMQMLWNTLEFGILSVTGIKHLNNLDTASCLWILCCFGLLMMLLKIVLLYLLMWIFNKGLFTYRTVRLRNDLGHFKVASYYTCLRKTPLDDIIIYWTFTLELKWEGLININLNIIFQEYWQMN